MLITRPREDAGPLAEELVRRGHVVLLEPLLEIVFSTGPGPDLAGCQGLLFTSANGVRALAGLMASRLFAALPAFAVGEATAAAARAAGFRTVHSADGDVFALARLVAGRCDPASGPLLHVAASERAGDLAGELGRGGFVVNRQVLYHARPAERLSDATAGALAAGAIDDVLLFSPRTARTMNRLIEAAGLAGACRCVAALCLSAAVAEAATGAGAQAHGAVAWGDIRIATRPDQDALLALLDAGRVSEDHQ